jgi:ABC-type nitrate/sulfonate/bicarbonate transport system permease component
LAGKDNASLGSGIGGGKTVKKHQQFRLGILASWAGFIFIITIWIIITKMELIQPEIFPGPIAVIKSTVENLTIARILSHIGMSLMRVLLGFILGGSAGIVLGVVCGWYVKLGSILRTPIELLRPIPPLAWIPLAIIWLGLDESSKIFIVSLGAFFPLFTNTYKGMITIEPNIIRAGQMLGLKSEKLLYKIVIPATLPDIATGMRLGWSYCFGCMVAAELIAADKGLGYMIMHARELGMIGVIVFGILLIGLINLLTDSFIQEFILRRKLRWHYIGTSE